MSPYIPQTLLSSSPADIWGMLPKRVGLPLLLSGSGDAYVYSCFETLVEELGRPDSPYGPGLRPVLNDMALHLWELNPLSAKAASLLLLLHDQQAFLPRELVPLCKFCRSLKPGEPRHMERLKALFLEGEFSEATRLLDRVSMAEKDNFFWLHYAILLGLRFGELDWYAGWLDRLELPGVLGTLLRADYLFARNSLSEAGLWYEKAFQASGLTEFLVRAGECRLRSGERDAAASCWRQAFARRPWQVNLLLRLSDLIRGNDRPGKLPDGRGLILLYSWNHGPDLDKALGSLADSELGTARIVALDNGCTDQTPQILSHWREKLGDRLEIITLPTNIGAPAARNWLLTLDAAREADWVVFLDDDAIVPPDWLGYFGKALELYPQAGIVGCRIVDEAVPMALQSVDLHFEAALDDSGCFKDQAPFQFVDSHQQSPDFGQYSYLRPATSVTGCCHLLTRRNIKEVGLFDLKYSPSQFDDLDRDLRSDSLGQQCVYQGHLQVRHIKRSGSVIKMSLGQKANSEGNLRKLLIHHPADRIAAYSRNSLVRMKQEFAARLEVLSPENVSK